MNQDLVVELASLVKCEEPRFLDKDFVNFAMSDIDNLWFSKWSRQIANGLDIFMPGSFRENVDILLKLKEPFESLRGRFLTEYVALKGITKEELNFSMRAIEKLAKIPFSEIPVMNFIELDREKAIEFVSEWAVSEDNHLRRLAARSINPRPNWKKKVDTLIEDPMPVIPILETLLGDYDLMVNSYVARVLDVISKDHPDIASQFIQEHYGENRIVDWVLQKGAKTFIRNNDWIIKRLLGFTHPKFIMENLRQYKFEIDPLNLKIGDQLEVTFGMLYRYVRKQKIRLECLVENLLPSGELRQKYYVLKNFKQETHTANVFKTKILFSERKRYKQFPGKHRGSIIVNGRNISSKIFRLIS
jgi:3-methyladenine DNA glycosylase AlkC